MPVLLPIRFLLFLLWSWLGVVSSAVASLYGLLVDCVSPSRRHVKQLEKELERAPSYEKWAEIANKLDKLTGADLWKQDPVSPDYDYELIQRRLQQLRDVRLSGDIWSLIFLLRSGLSRNIGGIGNPYLFVHSHFGTKQLIESYVSELQLCLEAIYCSDSPDLTLSAKIEFFSGLKKVFGQSALLLSGGASLGLYHIGVIKCLFEHNLLPRVFSGSSAGSLLAGLACTLTDEEMPTIFNPSNIDLEAIERSGEGTAQRRMARLLKTGYLFDVRVLQECIQKNIGDITFQEAYNRTRRILNITVSSSTIFEMPRLLNYLTAPNVLIWSAASASCAVPGLYQPVPIMAKDSTGNIVLWNPAGTRWVDGSVENDLPMARLSEQFNVNHFLVSQVNPHIIPFLTSKPQPNKSRFFESIKFLLVSELNHRANQVLELGLLPNYIRNWIHRGRSVLNQTYQGDITIVPPIPYSDYFSLMTNPDLNYVRENILKSERATWPKLSIIRMHCQTEKSLDSILYRLRVKMLEKTGRPYRPIEIALSVQVDEEAAANGVVPNSESGEHHPRLWRSPSLGSSLQEANPHIPIARRGLANMMKY